MIDLTPLDVRKKRGDFRRVLRGYDPQEVDSFIELVAERFEDLVKENLTLKERSERLESQVNSQEGREKAVQQALVTAQELREEIQTQAKREADFLKKEAEQEIDRILGDARRRLADHESTLEDLRRRRIQFLKQFKGLLTKELEMVELEEERATAAAEPLEIELSGGWRAEARERAAEAAREAEEEPAAPEPEPPAPEPEPPAPEPPPTENASASEPPASEAEPPEPVAEAEPEAAQEARGGTDDAEAEAAEGPAGDEAAAEAAELPAEDPAAGDAPGPAAASGTDEPLWLSSLLREGESKKKGKEKGEEDG